MLELRFLQITSNFAARFAKWTVAVVSEVIASAEKKQVNELG